MEIKGYEKFIELRRWFLAKLDEADMSDSHKSYEGTLEIGLSYPSYFESRADRNDEPEIITIILHCYVIGPNRHYTWYGKTIEEAVNKARKEIESWEY